MKNVSILLLFTLILAASQATLAVPGAVIIDFTPAERAEESAHRVKALIEQALNRLITQQLLRLGDVDIQEFQTAVHNTEIRVVKSVEVEAGIGRRHSAAWINQKVYLSEALLRENETTLTGVVLHEIAGTQNLDDANFELSALILHAGELFNSHPAARVRQYLNSAYGNLSFKVDPSLRLASAGGSISGVGGGGDSLLFRLKRMLVRKNFDLPGGQLDGLSNVDLKLARHVLTLKVELSPLVEIGDVRYSKDTLVLHRGTMENLSDSSLASCALQILSAVFNQIAKEGVTL